MPPEFVSSANPEGHDQSHRAVHPVADIRQRSNPDLRPATGADLSGRGPAAIACGAAGGGRLCRIRCPARHCGRVSAIWSSLPSSTRSIRIGSTRNVDLEECTRVGLNGQIYPSTIDAYPNCLHASSTANIHFHGTHTSPSSTGDNVYLQIRPLPRDNQGNLTAQPAAAICLDLTTSSSICRTAAWRQPAESPGRRSGAMCRRPVRRHADRRLLKRLSSSKVPLPAASVTARSGRFIAVGQWPQILHRRRIHTASRCRPIHGRGVAAASRQHLSEHGPVARHALVPRAQARLDRDQLSPTA